jgi:hypothetical protein
MRTIESRVAKLESDAGANGFKWMTNEELEACIKELQAVVALEASQAMETHHAKN